MAGLILVKVMNSKDEGGESVTVDRTFALFPSEQEKFGM